MKVKQQSCSQSQYLFSPVYRHSMCRGRWIFSQKRIAFCRANNTINSKFLCTKRGAMPCSNGFPIMAHRNYSEAMKAIDQLLVAGGPEFWRIPACSTINRSPHTGTMRLHWQCMYPKIKVDADRIFLQDSNLYTSAGLTADIDLSLYLLSNDAGPEVSLNVAKRRWSSCSGVASNRSSALT